MQKNSNRDYRSICCSQQPLTPKFIFVGIFSYANIVKIATVANRYRNQ